MYKAQRETTGKAHEGIKEKHPLKRKEDKTHCWPPSIVVVFLCFNVRVGACKGGTTEQLLEWLGCLRP
jgi:hypothetical protein